MKLKLILCCCLISILYYSCTSAQNCVGGIDTLPMYGNVKKCKEQIEVDQQFIAMSDKISDRKTATAHNIARGWEYLYKKDFNTAMKRFNEAWLLDSLNADIYWGFGDVLGMQGKCKESLPFFERSLKLNPNNDKVWQDEANSYGNVFYETKDVKFLNSAVYSLKKAIHISPNNAQYYGALTSAYSYFMQKDSARKYLAITDKIDPNAINPEVRAMLK